MRTRSGARGAAGRGGGALLRRLRGAGPGVHARPRHRLAVSGGARTPHPDTHSSRAIAPSKAAPTRPPACLPAQTFRHLPSPIDYHPLLTNGCAPGRWPRCLQGPEAGEPADRHGRLPENHRPRVCKEDPPGKHGRGGGRGSGGLRAEAGGLRVAGRAVVSVRQRLMPC